MNITSRLRRRVSQLLRLPMAGPLFKLYAPRRRWRDASSGIGPPRVLVINLLPSLGDTICYMPLAEILSDAVPGVETTWLADSAMAGLVAKHPDVHRVLTIATPKGTWSRMPVVKMYYRLYIIVRTLMRMELPHAFDLAILPRGGSDPSLSAHAAWVLNLPRTYAFSRRVEPDETDHHFGDSLVSHLVKKLGSIHESSRGIQLLQSTGLVPNATQRWRVEMQLRGLRSIAKGEDAMGLLAKAGVPPSVPYVVLAPGAGAPNRAWPALSFRELCKLILHETDFNVVITGTQAEFELGDIIAAGSGGRAFNCAGKFTLAALTGVLAHAKAFVGNDSGTGHIAGPLGIPVISLHTQAEGADPCHMRAPERQRPLGSKVSVLRPPSFLHPCRTHCEAAGAHCISQITPASVFNELMRALLMESTQQSSGRRQNDGAALYPAEVVSR